MTWIESFESRFLLAGGPAITGFKISPRNPIATTGSLVFTVTYTDVNGIDPTSLDNRDLRIAGPNGYARYATAAGSISNDLGTQRIVRYKIPARGGSWDSADNGTYTVRVHGGEVFDQLGNDSDSQLLGKFGVNIAAGGRVPQGVVSPFRATAPTKVIDLLDDSAFQGTR